MQHLWLYLVPNEYTHSYGLDDPRIVIRFLAGTRDFAALQVAHIGCGFHAAYYLMGTSPAVKRPERKAENLPPTRTEFMSGALSPQYSMCFHGVYRDGFAFTLVQGTCWAMKMKLFLNLCFHGTRKFTNFTMIRQSPLPFIHLVESSLMPQKQFISEYVSQRNI